ncbi:MAG: ATP-grasp domain-containing protein [Bacteroidales bacterium]|nr:ATP-grasp domain-containing protein [Bacteroidales bacterium]MBP5612689.1 ATP-grasp domain-containing protein [Bacteroidales bacterium]
MQERLLILGSDFGTISVVKEAHNAGMYVIVADLMESSPSKIEADEAWFVSTTDIDTLEKKSRECGVTAIMFGASDFNISNCRILCKRLSFPIYCDNDYTWSVARNKRLFKNICKKVGAPVAADYEFNDDQLESVIGKVAYPVVVKPCDKSGNRGMSYCSNEKELREAYQLARSISDQSIIVERQLRGEEYNVHYVLAEGEARLLYFSSSHHEPGCASNIYSFKNTTSCHLRQYIEEVNDSVKRVFKEAGCKDGIVWVDIMRDSDGKFYLLEMGYRFGGVMTYRPYAMVSGFNTIKWMLDLSRGIKHGTVDLPPELSQAYRGCAASYHLFTKHSGIVKEVNGIELLEGKEEEGFFVDMPKRAGASVREKATMGLIGIYGEDINDLCDKLRSVNASLSVKDEDGNDLVIVYDDYETIKREYQLGMKQYGKN